MGKKAKAKAKAKTKKKQDVSFIRLSAFSKNKWKKRGIILIFLFASLILLIHVHHFQFKHLIDDAYISFRYADNFIHGNGLVYNEGERVEGYTNFLWVILLSGFMSVGLCPIKISKILGILFSLLSLLTTFWISKEMAGNNRRKEDIYDFIPAVFLVYNSSYCVWTTGGLETHLFGFLLLLGILFYLKGIYNRKSNIYSSIFYVFACMSRPEGVLFVFISFIHRLISGIIKRNKIYLQDAFIFVGSFIILSLPYLLFKLWYYGEILPNTFYVKVVSGQEVFNAGKFYITEFVTQNFNILLLINFVILCTYNIKEFGVTYLMSLILPFCVYIFWIGGDFFPCFRFFVPILPLFCILIGTSFRIISHRFQKYKLLVYSFIVLTIGYSLYHSFNSSPRGTQSKDLVIKSNEVEKDRIDTGRWLADRLPSSTSMALNPAGIIPFYTRFYTIDMLGLNDKHIGRKKVGKLTSGALAHLKFDSDYVLSKNPDLIIIGACELLKGKISKERIIEYYQFIVNAIPGDRALLENKRLFEEYDLMAAKIKDDKFLPLFVSKKKKGEIGNKFIPVLL
ncbi:MAG: hypothetical protein AB1567_10605 [bacterium]